MKPYLNPNVRILTIRRRLLRKWRTADFKVSFWRLYWNSRNGAKIVYNDKTISLTPKTIVLVPPHTAISQRMTSHPPTPHFFAHFFVDAPYDRPHSNVYTFEAEPGMLDILKALPVSEHLINDLGRTMMIRGLIHHLLARIPKTDLRLSCISSRMAENMSFIETHIQQAVSNEEIARHLGTSVCVMLRRYRHDLGISPQAYLRQKRVEKACMLLHDPQQSIEQIAQETGFYDRYHFSRVFKTLQGFTPSKYRIQFCV